MSWCPSRGGSRCVVLDGCRPGWSCARGGCHESEEAAARLRADGQRFHVSRVGRLRSQGEGPVRESVRRHGVEARGEGRQRQDQQGLAVGQGDRRPLPAARRREDEQAERHLGRRQSAVGHRHRRRVGIRSEDAQRAESWRFPASRSRTIRRSSAIRST